MSRMTLQATTTSTDTPATGAACAASADLMFPLAESQRAGQRSEGELVALAVCARCPVQAACVAAVLDTLDTAPMVYGVAAGMTAADRREVRAVRRGLTRPTTLAEAPVVVPAPAAVVTVLDEAVARAIAAHPDVVPAPDPVVVAALARAEGPGWSSRWETALGAVVLLDRGHSMSATARLLGEDLTQVRRWRDRHASGEALVRGACGVGTTRLRRPAHLVTTTPDAAASVAVSVVGERGVA